MTVTPSVVSSAFFPCLRGALQAGLYMQGCLYHSLSATFRFDLPASANSSTLSTGSFTQSGTSSHDSLSAALSALTNESASMPDASINSECVPAVAGGVRVDENLVDTQRNPIKQSTMAKIAQILIQGIGIVLLLISSAGLVCALLLVLLGALLLDILLLIINGIKTLCTPMVISSVATEGSTTAIVV